MAFSRPIVPLFPSAEMFAPSIRSSFEATTVRIKRVILSQKNRTEHVFGSGLWIPCCIGVQCDLPFIRVTTMLFDEKESTVTESVFSKNGIIHSSVLSSLDAFEKRGPQKAIAWLAKVLDLFETAGLNPQDFVRAYVVRDVMSS